MAFREDLNIRLIADGNAVDYENISQIKMPLTGGGTGKFTHLHSLYAYMAQPTDDPDRILIVENAWLWAGSDDGGNYVMLTASDSLCKSYGFLGNNGQYTLMIIMTPKVLTIGQTYHKDDL